jgi:hypothetical protein
MMAKSLKSTWSARQAQRAWQQELKRREEAIRSNTELERQVNSIINRYNSKHLINESTLRNVMMHFDKNVWPGKKKSVLNDSKLL